MKKGVSLTALIVIIAVLIILSSTIVFVGNSSYESQLMKSYASELVILGKRIDDYYLFNKKYPVKDVDIILNINTINSELLQEMQDELVVSDEITLKELDLYKIDITSFKRGVKKDSNTNDIYVYSELTDRIYYLEGYNIKENKYYSLNSELQEYIN